MNKEDFAKEWIFYRIMAVVVGTFLLVLTALLIWVRVLENPKPEFYDLGWTIHGWLFPIYVIATFILSIKLRWSFGKTILIMLAGTIPFMSFVTERNVAREVAAGKQITDGKFLL
jgi:integral membrane protein